LSFIIWAAANFDGESDSVYPVTNDKMRNDK